MDPTADNGQIYIRKAFGYTPFLSSPSPKPSPPRPNPKPKEVKNPKSYGTGGDTIFTKLAKRDIFELRSIIEFDT